MDYAGGPEEYFGDNARKENERLKIACRLVLLFHSGSPWDFEKQQEWANGLTDLMGPSSSRRIMNSDGKDGDKTWEPNPSNEATTRNLCNAVRAALTTECNLRNKPE